jgi:molybdate transport system regulatory protein
MAMGIWIFFNLDFCQGKNGIGIHRANILEAVDRFGSISAAALAVDLTFGQTWRVIRLLNSLSDQPLVAARRGGRNGGAYLTPLGKQVLAGFRRVEQVIKESTGPYIHELEKVVGIHKKPTVVPRFAQIIDPSTIRRKKKSTGRLKAGQKIKKQKAGKSRKG